MADDPSEIADYLVKEYGVDGALQAAIEATAKANNEYDYYALSVWREVKVILRERKKAA